MNQRTLLPAQEISVEPTVTSRALRGIASQDPNRGGRPYSAAPLPKYIRVLNQRYHKQLDIERAQLLENTRFLWGCPGLDETEFEYRGYEPRPKRYPLMRTTVHERV